jgi:hypothetical protein
MQHLSSGDGTIVDGRMKTVIYVTVKKEDGNEL